VTTDEDSGLLRSLFQEILFERPLGVALERILAVEFVRYHERRIRLCDLLERFELRDESFDALAVRESGDRIEKLSEVLDFRPVGFPAGSLDSTHRVVQEVREAVDEHLDLLGEFLVGFECGAECVLDSFHE